MASKFVIFDGDQVTFLPIPGVTIIPLMTGLMTGSGKQTLSGKKTCVEGDEKQLKVPCTYFTPAFPIAGSGEFTIDQLGGDQLTSKTKMGGKAVIRKGSMFTSKFTASVKAMHPTNGPEPVGQFSGQGQLITTNSKIQAD